MYFVEVPETKSNEDLNQSSGSDILQSGCSIWFNLITEMERHGQISEMLKDKIKKKINVRSKAEGKAQADTPIPVSNDLVGRSATH